MTVCPNGWVSFRGSCYLIRFESTKLGWDDASNWCLKNQAALASISDPEISNFFTNYFKGLQLLSQKALWIGWRSGTSTWPSGISTLYRNWECNWFLSSYSWQRSAGYLFTQGQRAGQWGADQSYVSLWSESGKQDGFICERTPSSLTAESREFTHVLLFCNNIQECWLFSKPVIFERRSFALISV